MLGDKVWANNVLRIVARRCSQAGSDTALQGLRSLVLWSTHALEEHGFPWQAQRCKNHYNRYLQRMKSVDSSLEEKGGDFLA